MQEHPKGAGEEPAITTGEEDGRQEAAVLRRVLELDPAALTMDDLVRELTGNRYRPEIQPDICPP